MHLFWKDIILPIMTKINPNIIIEIGDENGIYTTDILEYCNKNNSRLTSILTESPHFNINKISQEYGEKFNLNITSNPKDILTLNYSEIIFINEIPNYNTLSNTLKGLEDKFKPKFPFVFMQNTCKTLKENETIAPIELGYFENYKNFYVFTKDNLSGNNETSHLNYTTNLKTEIFNEIKTFISNTNLNISFINIPLCNGLGMLFLEDEKNQQIIEEIINNPLILEKLENNFLKQIYENTNLNNNDIGTLKYINQKEIKINQLTNEKITLNELNIEKNNTILKLRNEKTKLKQTNLEKENKIKQLTNEKIMLYQVIDEKDIVISNISNENKKLLNRSITLTKSKHEHYRLYKEQTQKLNEITKEKNSLGKKVEKNNKDLSDLKALTKKQEEEINLLKKDNEKNTSKIAEYESSHSWKITKPMRKVVNKLKSIKNKI